MYKFQELKIDSPNLKICPKLHKLNQMKSRLKLYFKHDLQF